MITRSQIKQLKEYFGTPEKIQHLVLKWEQELDFQELNKKGKLEIIKKPYRGDATPEKVIATEILDGIFAYHKGAFGYKGYSITHVQTAETLCSGKLSDIKLAITYLEKNAKGFIEEIRTLNEDGLRILSPEKMAIMRNAHNIANGNHAPLEERIKS
ncbi:hypothetical protein EKK58_12770 [Candidatus Dependentiae bacterium]|nr:MAG: hypothetical protein EKK58_12770 [Candidatus Dependentiae bacterium]